MPSPLESIHIVAERLDPLEIPYAFLGGAVMVLLVDHPALVEFRPTKDVDVIVEAVSYSPMSIIEQRLRDHGFKHDTSAGAPICRWIIEGCKLDVMPTDGTVFGMNSRWFPQALKLARRVSSGGNFSVNVITPAFFLATKLDAFKDRGNGDYYVSHDIEDIVTLVDGRSAIVQDVAAAPSDVAAFVASAFAELLQTPDFQDAFPGHLSGLMGARERRYLVLERFGAISKL